MVEDTEVMRLKWEARTLVKAGQEIASACGTYCFTNEMHTRAHYSKLKDEAHQAGEHLHDLLKSIEKTSSVPLLRKYVISLENLVWAGKLLDELGRIRLEAKAAEDEA